MRLFPYILTAVEAIEKLMKSGKGKEKQDAAADLAKTLLASIEGSLGKDLLNDADVDKAVRGVIDAIVALQNIVASKSVK